MALVLSRHHCRKILSQQRWPPPMKWSVATRASSHAWVTSAKSQQHLIVSEWMSEWVTDKVRQWSDLGPIKTLNSLKIRGGDWQSGEGEGLSLPKYSRRRWLWPASCVTFIQIQKYRNKKQIQNRQTQDNLKTFDCKCKLDKLMIFCCETRLELKTDDSFYLHAHQVRK